MVTRVKFAIGGALMALAVSSFAVPVRTTPDPIVTSGILGHWVDVTTSPHSTGDALAALAGAGGFTIARTVDVVHKVIDVGDCCGAGSLDPLSALGDDNFAVHYTGYLRIDTRGSYRFRMHHDDGIRVILGGETIIDFPFDTGERDTDSASFGLEPGFYALDIVGWEQGGAFVNQFFMAEGTLPFALAGDLWHDATVPAPATLALTGLALLALRRRLR